MLLLCVEGVRVDVVERRAGAAKKLCRAAIDSDAVVRMSAELEISRQNVCEAVILNRGLVVAHRVDAVLVRVGLTPAGRRTGFGNTGRSRSGTAALVVVAERALVALIGHAVRVGIRRGRREHAVQPGLVGGAVHAGPLIGDRVAVRCGHVGVIEREHPGEPWAARGSDQQRPTGVPFVCR